MPRAGSASVHTGIDATELRNLKRGIRALKPDHPEFARQLGQAYKRSGEIIVKEAQARAAAAGGLQAKAAPAIAPSVATGGVSIRISASGRSPYGLAAFFGATRHSGWYAAGRYSTSSAPQFAPWVGASWAVGQAGEGPYAINDAIAATLDDALGEWADAIEQLMSAVPTE